MQMHAPRSIYRLFYFYFSFFVHGRIFAHDIKNSIDILWDYLNRSNMNDSFMFQLYNDKIFGWWWCYIEKEIKFFIFELIFQKTFAKRCSQHGLPKTDCPLCTSGHLIETRKVYKLIKSAILTFSTLLLPPRRIGLTNNGVPETLVVTLRTCPLINWGLFFSTSHILRKIILQSVFFYSIGQNKRGLSKTTRLDRIMRPKLQIVQSIHHTCSITWEHPRLYFQMSDEPLVLRK